jgi:D-lyxose ketol-isomerase
VDINKDKLRVFEVVGEEKKKNLSKIFEQAETWGITLPETPSFMLHFGLYDFFVTGETEFWVANEVDAGYCAKFLFVFEGQTCPYHRHKVKHETFYILKGDARMVINEEVSVKNQGELLAMAPGTKHSFTGEGGACLLLEISMPSVPGDSYFDNQEIGKGGIL